MCYDRFSNTSFHILDLAEEIFQLVESSVENVDPNVWPKIKRKAEEKEKLVRAAEDAAKKAVYVYILC